MTRNLQISHDIMYVCETACVCVCVCVLVKASIEDICGFTSGNRAYTSNRAYARFVLLAR